MFFLKLNITANARIANATNKTPCSIPTTLTGEGMFAKYFKGIAMHNKTKKEMPSAKATLRNRGNMFFIIQVNKKYH